MLLLLLLLLLLLVWGPVSALSAEIVVTTTADSGPGSLREALLVAQASPGSTVRYFHILLFSCR